MLSASLQTPKPSTTSLGQYRDVLSSGSNIVYLGLGELGQLPQALRHLIAIRSQKLVQVLQDCGAAFRRSNKRFAVAVEPRLDTRPQVCYGCQAV